jgi:hypothetical protein
MGERIMKKISIQGVHHLVKKNKNGDIVVEHTNIKNGKYDKINLTKKTKAKTVSEGIKSTKEWHKENPYHEKTKRSKVTKR